MTYKGGGCMVLLSRAAKVIIIEELEVANRHCISELASLPLSKTGSHIYQYWETRQANIETALKELKNEN